MNSNYPFRLSARIGVLLIVVSVVMMYFGRQANNDVLLPPGFSSVILAIEFSQTSTGLSSIIVQLSDQDREALTKATWVDTLFLLAYGSFLFTMLTAIYHIIGIERYRIWAYLGVLAAMADFGENVIILQSLGGAEVNMGLLKLFTWTKWLSLAGAFLFIGRFLTTTGRVFDKMLGIACFAPLPLGLISLLGIANLTETFAGLFYLLFPLTILYCWFSGISKSQDSVNEST